MTCCLLTRRLKDKSTEKLHLECKALNCPLHVFIKSMERNTENDRSNPQLL